MQRPRPHQGRRSGSGLFLRLLTGVGVLALLLAWTPGAAHAHGGVFMPPPDAPPTPPPPPPPPLPPPPPPKPPRPPPPPRPTPPPVSQPPHTPGPARPPVTKPPVTQPPGTPPTSAPPNAPAPPTGTPPITPPTRPGPTNGPDRPKTPRPAGRGTARGGRTAPTANLEDQWQTWWVLNRLSLLPDRTEAVRHAVVTPGRNQDETERRAIWSMRRAVIGKRQVVPLLLRLVDPKTRARNEVVASALIALGKVCTDHAVLEVLNDHLRDHRAAPLVRESAALALGLIARDQPQLQRSAPELDWIRDRLITAFDDEHLHLRGRAFAALSLGLLGDQPFSMPYAKDGRLVTRALWTRLEDTEDREELTVALLTALGMQPGAGIPDGVRGGLKKIVAGRRALGRPWNSSERSHALTALLRIGGPDTFATLRRVVARKREHVDLRRAAYLTIPELLGGLNADEREELARHLHDALRNNRDPLTTGLGQIAMAHVLGADLRASGERVLRNTHAEQELLDEARNGATPTRGFSAIALALAVRDVKATSPEVSTFVANANDVLLRGLTGGRGDDRMRAAYAVAVGVAGTHEALGSLVAIVGDANADPELRGHAAVALGDLGRRTPEVQRILFGALSQRRYAELRRQAALGMALLGGRVVGTQLLKELETGETEQLLAQVVIALGRLGDLQAVSPLAEYASDAKRSELAQALSVVALGMLADPQPRPTLLRLSQNANYPSRTAALHEAFTIL